MVPHTSGLPSKTLLVTLKPPGQIFYLPHFQTQLLHPSSPGLEYSSDPENTLKKTKLEDVNQTISFDERIPEDTTRVQPRKDGDLTNIPVKRLAYTASYQQLFEWVSRHYFCECALSMVTRLVNSQALILEHESNLLNLIEKIDRHFEDDPVFPLVCRSW